MFGNLQDDEMLQLLREQIVGRIGCCAENFPYIIPVSYAYSDNAIYIHTTMGMKIDMLRKNPIICFQVDDTTDLANWKSVICRGTYEELEDKEEKTKALHVLNNRVIPPIASETMHLTSHWPFNPSRTTAIEGIFFRINIKEMTGRFEKAEVHNYFAS